LGFLGFDRMEKDQIGSRRWEGVRDGLRVRDASEASAREGQKGKSVVVPQDSLLVAVKMTGV